MTLNPKLLVIVGKDPVPDQIEENRLAYQFRSHVPFQETRYHIHDTNNNNIMNTDYFYFRFRII